MVDDTDIEIPERGRKMILVIFGASGQAKEVKEIADMANCKNLLWEAFVFIDDFKDEGTFKGCHRMHLESAIEKYGINNLEFIVALGEPRAKKAVFERLKNRGCRFCNVISPRSQISPDARLGEGIIIKSGAIISPDAEVGDNTTIQSYACIGHDVVVGKHCQISTHVDIGGGSKIGDCVFVGLNVPIREKLLIGEGAILSAGAVVLKNVEANVTVMGNPARIISKNDDTTKVFG
ncbi:MAG: acetyltransferase [Bacteroides thetaiotaomicron]|nr:acetyltransferase [Bacteroides thetaiotaomicron]